MRQEEESEKMSEETVNAEGTAAEVVGAGSSDEHPATSEATLNGAPAAQPEQSAIPKRHLRKTRVGEVVSNKMDKTIVVEVVRRVRHAKFGKIVKANQKVLRARRAESVCNRGLGAR